MTNRFTERAQNALNGALREASAAGVHVLAMDCAVTPDSMELRLPVLVKL